MSDLASAHSPTSVIQSGISLLHLYSRCRGQSWASSGGPNHPNFQPDGLNALGTLRSPTLTVSSCYEKGEVNDTHRSGLLWIHFNWQATVTGLVKVEEQFHCGEIVHGE